MPPGPIWGAGCSSFFSAMTHSVVRNIPVMYAAFSNATHFLTIKKPQIQILNEYIADMSKYASPATVIKIRSCYNSMPTQLANENKKFQNKSGTKMRYGKYFRRGHRMVKKRMRCIEMSKIRT
jgi:hypothetical protein